MAEESAVRSLVQFERDGARGVAALDRDGGSHAVSGSRTVIELAHEAARAGLTLAQMAAGRMAEPIDLSTVTLLAPVDHPDPAHVTVSADVLLAPK